MSAPLPGGRALGAPLLARDSEPTIFEFLRPGTPRGLVQDHEPAFLDGRGTRSGRFPAERSVGAAGGFRTCTSSRTSLVSLIVSTFRGSRCLPARFVHDEVQPEGGGRGASLPGFTQVHRRAPVNCAQGWLELLVELEETLCAITGMHAATLQPAAGPRAKLTGLLLMHAYHDANGESDRGAV